MKIELTEQEIAVIGTALGKQPYAEVFQVIDSLNKQVNAQLAEPKEQ